MHTENDRVEITKEKAKDYLEVAYIKSAVDDIIDNEKAFRLRTPFRDVWTMTNDGMLPMAGFYGICE